MLDLPLPVISAPDALARGASLLQALYARLGPQGWWPVRSVDPIERAIEICVGAVLVQNTNWTQVDRVLTTLAERELFSARRLLAMPLSELATLTRSAGYPNVKPRRLQALMQFILTQSAGDPRQLATGIDPGDEHAVAGLRTRLLAVPGTGPETADCILLYVLNLPVMVADAYALRVASRHGLLPTSSKYEHVKMFWSAAVLMWHARGLAIPAVQSYNEAHALLVAVGKTWCRTTPRCAGCVLQADLVIPSPDIGPNAPRTFDEPEA